MLLPGMVREILEWKTMIMIYGTISMGAIAMAVLAGSATLVTTEDSPHAEHMLKCAKTCSACSIDCDSCFHHCALLVADGKKDHAACMHLCVDCAECCRLCATFCARQSTMSAHAAECCAKCCEDCAAACEKMADDKQMVACAKVCRDCAKSCREMAKMTK